MKSFDKAANGAKETPSDAVAYLAYGSNLSSKTFLERRGIRPLAWHAVYVPTLDLMFDLPGAPYLEPCFANVRVNTEAKDTASSEMEFTPLLKGNMLADRPHGLYGVVYWVTAQDYAKIILTEGGGASYKDVLVWCYPLDKNVQPMEAHTLHAGPPTIRTIDPSAEPSPRYLKLLVDGSKEHELPEKWINYLSSLPTYRPTTWGQKAGKYAMMVTFIPTFILFNIVSRLTMDKGGRTPPWVQSIFAYYTKIFWWTYDNIIKKICGDGERSGGHGTAQMNDWERREVEYLEEAAEKL